MRSAARSAFGAADGIIVLRRDRTNTDSTCYSLAGKANDKLTRLFCCKVPRDRLAYFRSVSECVFRPSRPRVWVADFLATVGLRGPGLPAVVPIRLDHTSGIPSAANARVAG
jgi:hypothetical protein